LIDFEEIKDHDIFELVKTDTLENFAYRLDDKDGCRFADFVREVERKIENALFPD
jgi:hypothetical protein